MLFQNATPRLLYFIERSRKVVCRHDFGQFGSMWLARLNSPQPAMRMARSFCSSILALYYQWRLTPDDHLPPTRSTDRYGLRLIAPLFHGLCDVYVL